MTCSDCFRCRLVLTLQLRQVSQQFLFAGQAAEVKADHLVGPPGRLAVGPQTDQQTGDDGTVRLDLDAVLAVAEQVPATQQVFEKSEEDFTLPSIMPPLSQLLCHR